ncbi:MAG: hypothetical protein R6V85_07690 [Polyangia bacterium]
MPAVNPRTFFRFAAEHHALLTELYYRREGLPDAELLELIRRHSDLQSPSASYLRDRLLELGILEPAPEATAQLEMTRPVAALVGYLLREYRLTSVEVIQSYFQAIESLGSELSSAVARGNSEILVRVNAELEDHVERMRHDSRNNRERVIADVMRVKTNRERLNPRQRYELVNRLWTRYIVPLRDVIDTQKVMDAALDRLEGIYRDAHESFAGDGVVQRVIRGGEARLRRLRRDVLGDFQETVREVTPLYEELRHETAVARGAARALERVSKEGLAELGLSRIMGVCNWQQRGLFGDGALESYLAELRGYDPLPPDPLSPARKDGGSPRVDPVEFSERARAAVPIEDALEWLLGSYPEAGSVEVLRLYGRLHSGRFGATSFAAKSREYPVADLLLVACPMAIVPDRDPDREQTGGGPR